MNEWMKGLKCENWIWYSTLLHYFEFIFLHTCVTECLLPLIRLPLLGLFVWVECKLLEGKPNLFDLFCRPLNTHGYLFRFHLGGYLSRFSETCRNGCWLLPTKADSQNTVGTEGHMWTQVWYQASSHLPLRVQRCYTSTYQAFQKQLVTFKSLFSKENSCV